MSQQLHDSEVRERAKLSVDGFIPEAAETWGGMARIKGKWVITNTGPTVATILYSGTGGGVGHGAAPQNFLGTTVGPINEGEPKGGSWMKVGAQHEIPVDMSSGTVLGGIDAINRRQAFFAVDFSLAYKDIFGHVWWLFDCEMYDARAPENVRQCPLVTRIPPEDYEAKPQKLPWWSRLWPWSK
jgi:hypothetical protein